MTTLARRRVVVEGVVQGVGFRPYVYGLAVSLNLHGFVCNDFGGVTIEVEGDSATLERFPDILAAHLPPLAQVQRVTVEDLRVAGDTSFVITESDARPVGQALVTADMATCPECRSEVFDPAARRFGYPFTNCTNCGPRYTITTAVPYDRGRTTMSGFVLCPACAAEYADPADRRFHAQPIACPDCGPALSCSIEEAAALLRAGRIVALKGLGGYQLACDGADPGAVARLRARKHRPHKPFALMVPDLETARELCLLSGAEERLLASQRAPIVLCRRRPGAAVADEVAPGSRWLGLMLPTTPLHHLLLAGSARPLVMTSGNLSDEPIVVSDADARLVLGRVADAFLSHNRPIAARADDSVARVTAAGPLLLRRARGYAPEPVLLPVPLTRPVIGAGGQQKHTFCLAAGSRAVLSPHIGDLSTVETMHAFTGTVEHYGRLFGITPEVVAHDLHPDYLSSRWALEEAGLEAVGVQHHHAHIVSCLADNGRSDKVIGLALDGTGYGTDGTLWGGEILVCDLAGFERAGHLAAVRMPGGETAVREPWRMAAAYLVAARGPDVPPPWPGADRARWAAVTSLAASGLASPLTSGAGRLFDAAAAVVTGRTSASYEGQAATELEQVADHLETGILDCPVEATAGGLLLDTPAMFAELVSRHAAGCPAPELAARFHNGLAAALVEAATAVGAARDLGVVALSGGCFQNALLTDRVTGGLRAAGFEVLTHHQVPPNDGGLSLGQAVAATAGRI